MVAKSEAAAGVAQHWFLTTLGIAASLVAAGLAFAVFLANRIVGPLRELTTTAARIAAGDLDAKATVDSRDEVGILAAGFNTMAERIRNLRRSDLGKSVIAQQTTEAAIDSLYDPVIITDAHGGVTKLNPAAEEVFGAEAENQGKHIEEIARDGRIAVAVSEALRSQRPVAGEGAASVLPLDVDGVERAFRLRTTPMRDDEGGLMGAVTLLEDITHLREIDRLKSEFIATASHELRTPLTSVQMSVHLLLEGAVGDLTDKQRTVLRILSRRLRAARKVDARPPRSLEDRGRESAPNRAPVRVGDLMGAATGVLKRRADAKRVALVAEVPSDLPPVLADREQIERVVTNLLTNALRYTDAGGSIEVRAARRDGHVAVSVTDTGRGIPPEFLPSIFDSSPRFPALRREAPGWASRFPSGSWRHTAARSSSSQSSGAGPRSHSPCRWRHHPRPRSRHPHEERGMAQRILIIDDEDHIRQVMRLTLEAAGYEAGEAADGPRGLEEFGDGSTWDAVLLDQKMPGMDGLETLRHIKERNAAARVIMVTAFASIELAVDAMKFGATDFVRKPMTPEILRNAVTAALAKPLAPSPLASKPAGQEAAGQIPPPVSRFTMNGFRFWADPNAAEWQRREPRQRRFVVQHPDGRHQEIIVEFAAEAMGVVERATPHPLPTENTFWSWLAERLLNAFLWNEGKEPPGGKLTIEANSNRSRYAADGYALGKQGLGAVTK